MMTARLWTRTGRVLGLLALLARLLVAAPAVGATPARNASATITSDWTAFFSGATSAQRKIALLQNGSKFATIIRAQASSPLSKSSKAKVLKVSDITGTSASVRYTIYLGSTPALVNQRGTAVYAHRTWQVSDTSFCALLSLEGTKTANCRK